KRTTELQPFFPGLPVDDHDSFLKDISRIGGGTIVFSNPFYYLIGVFFVNFIDNRVLSFCQGRYNVLINMCLIRFSHSMEDIIVLIEIIYFSTRIQKRENP